MKRIFNIRTLTLGLLISLCMPLTNALAQGDGKPSGAIQALKVGFITERLQLSSEEAELFWPIYNEYNDKKYQLRKECNQKKGADDFMECEKKQVALKNDYHAKFKNVLHEEKLGKLYQAEKDFKRKLLEESRKRKTNRPGNTVPDDDNH